ncbi:unnamed protein product, partial [marine sediment metagenome]
YIDTTNNMKYFFYWIIGIVLFSIIAFNISPLIKEIFNQLIIGFKSLIQALNG